MAVVAAYVIGATVVGGVTLLRRIHKAMRREDVVDVRG